VCGLAGRGEPSDLVVEHQKAPAGERETVVGLGLAVGDVDIGAL
jgi:hypothetical protein